MLMLKAAQPAVPAARGWRAFLALLPFGSYFSTHSVDDSSRTRDAQDTPDSAGWREMVIRGLRMFRAWWAYT